MTNRFERFALSVLELNRILQKIKDAEMKKFGLRANHVMCLYYLGQNEEGLTSAQLTALCKEDKAAVSRSLNQLLENNLIFCDPAPEKRPYRAKHYLTDSGKALVKKVNEKIEAALVKGGNGLTEEQRDNFYDSMEIILCNLSNYFNQEEK